jgi:predicted O-methyltransferase YrrM
MGRTLVHRLYQPVSRFLPAPLAGAVRRFATAALTPIYFSVASGHFRSALAQKAVTAKGVPLPWYTYPAIDFLAANNFARRSVLEFGGGQSTLWWAARADRVITQESDPAWYEQLRRQAPANAVVMSCRSDLGDFSVPAEKFDVVVVDGGDRFTAARRGEPLLKPDGALIFDNSEGFWGPEGTYPIIDMMRDLGYQRVDFSGYAPGVIGRHCTSIFFRSGCFLFAGRHNPRA